MATRAQSPTQARWGPVLVFLGLAYGLAWAVQIGLVLALRADPQGLASLGGGMLVAALALMWPPAIGAFVARRWLEGGNFADAGLRRPPLRYLLIAWFGPAVLTVLAMLISLPIYPFDPSLSALGRMAEAAGQPLPAEPGLIVLIQVVSALTVAVLINSVFAFGEEFGWRGYLLPRLMDLLGGWPGLVLHGAIWGFWHAPLIFLAGYNYPGHNLLGVPLFVMAGMLMGVLLGWLQLRSGSVFAPTVAHGALNAIAGLPLLLLAEVDPAVAGVLYSPVGWIVMLAAIGLLIATGSLQQAMHRRAAGEP